MEGGMPPGGMPPEAMMEQQAKVAFYNENVDKGTHDEAEKSASAVEGLFSK
jgi:hypothetical protein